jgi:hypothetical protein
VTVEPLFDHVVFSGKPWPVWIEANLTEGIPYRVVGVNEEGTACVIDDTGELWPLDDGYGCRFPFYAPVNLPTT